AVHSCAPALPHELWKPRQWSSSYVCQVEVLIPVLVNVSICWPSLQVAPQLFGLMIAPCTWTLATTASTLDSRKQRTWRKAGQIPHAAMQPGQAACSKAPSPRSGAAG